MTRFVALASLLLLTTSIGAVPFGREISIAGSTESRLAAKVAWNGDVYGVAWIQSDGVWFARISASGAYLQSVRLAETPLGLRVAVAANRTSFLIAWTEGTAADGQSAWYIRGVRVSRSGSVLDHQPLLLSEETERAGVRRELAAASDGEDFMVVSDAIRPQSALPYAIVAALLTSEGVRLTSNELVAEWPTPVENPAVSFVGPDYLVSWVARAELRHAETCVYAGFPPLYVHQATNVFAARMNEVGVRVGTIPVQISREGANHLFPSVSVGADDVTIAWVRSAGGCYAAGDIRSIVIPRAELENGFTVAPTAGNTTTSESGLFPAYEAPARFGAHSGDGSVVYGWGDQLDAQLSVLAGGDTAAVLEGPPGSLRFFDIAARDDLHGIVIYGTNSGLALRTFGQQNRRRGAKPQLNTAAKAHSQGE